jgi:hypothetical protein
MLRPPSPGGRIFLSQPERLCAVGQWPKRANAKMARTGE